jgi:hypothetical protein
LQEKQSILRHDRSAELVVNADAGDATVEFGSRLRVYDSECSGPKETGAIGRECAVVRKAAAEQPKSAVTTGQSTVAEQAPAPSSKMTDTNQSPTTPSQGADTSTKMADCTAARF